MLRGNGSGSGRRAYGSAMPSKREVGAQFSLIPIPNGTIGKFARACARSCGLGRGCRRKCNVRCSAATLKSPLAARDHERGRVPRPIFLLLLLPRLFLLSTQPPPPLAKLLPKVSAASVAQLVAQQLSLFLAKIVEGGPRLLWLAGIAASPSRRGHRRRDASQ
eukprot:scaffold184881_cov24-Tisochrysis_lutea.AAC.2